MEKMADLQGAQHQRRQWPEADVQGQDDDRQGRRPDRSLLLRPRPHQRRRLGRLPGAAHRPLGRHLRQQESAAHRHGQWRQRLRHRASLQKAHDGIKNVDTSSTATRNDDDLARPADYARFNQEFLAAYAPGWRRASRPTTSRRRGSSTPNTPAIRRRRPASRRMSRPLPPRSRSSREGAARLDAAAPLPEQCGGDAAVLDRHHCSRHDPAVTVA